MGSQPTLYPRSCTLGWLSTGSTPSEPSRSMRQRRAPRGQGPPGPGLGVECEHFPGDVGMGQNPVPLVKVANACSSASKWSHRLCPMAMYLHMEDSNLLMSLRFHPAAFSGEGHELTPGEDPLLGKGQFSTGDPISNQPNKGSHPIPCSMGKHGADRYIKLTHETQWDTEPPHTFRCFVSLCAQGYCSTVVGIYTEIIIGD